jgi:hypothetical protein
LPARVKILKLLLFQGGEVENAAPATKKVEGAMSHEEILSEAECKNPNAFDMEEAGDDLIDLFKKFNQM